MKTDAGRQPGPRLFDPATQNLRRFQAVCSAGSGKAHLNCRLAAETDLRLGVFGSPGDGGDVSQGQQSAVLGHDYGQVSKGIFAPALVLEAKLQGGLPPPDDANWHVP